MKNFLDAATHLFVSKECKPIELWALLLRFLKNLPDDTLNTFKQDIHQVSKVAAQFIIDDIPNCNYHQYLQMQVLSSGETTILADRVQDAISNDLLTALREDQWAGPREALSRKLPPPAWVPVPE